MHDRARQVERAEQRVIRAQQKVRRLQTALEQARKEEQVARWARRDIQILANRVCRRDARDQGISIAQQAHDYLRTHGPTRTASLAKAVGVEMPTLTAILGIERRRKGTFDNPTRGLWQLADSSESNTV